MATPAENLATSLANISTALVAATANPKPNYNIDGQQVAWADYIKMLTSQYNAINAAIGANEPYEFVTQAF